MDCCSSSSSSSSSNSSQSLNQSNLNKNLKESKGGIKIMDRRIVLWIVIAILAVLAIYVLFFKNPSSSGNVVSAAQSAGQAAQSYGGMVGGC